MAKPATREMLSKCMAPNRRLVSAQISLCKTLAKVLGVLNGEGIVFSTSQLLIKLPALEGVAVVLLNVHVRIQ